MKGPIFFMGIMLIFSLSAKAAIVLSPREFVLTGAVQVFEGDQTGVEFPEGAATKYSSIVGGGSDQTVVIDASPTNADFYFNYGSVALDINGAVTGTGLDTSSFRYVEIHYSLSDDFVGPTHQLRLDSSDQPPVFDTFNNAATIPATAGAHSIIIDLLSDDGSLVHGRWTGDWEVMRWDFWNNGGNEGKAFTLDKIVFGPSVNRTRARPAALVMDAGGLRVSNGQVNHDGSMGGIGGISTQAIATAKHSYIGQLYDLDALQLTASPQTVNENGTRQLSAALVMDDDTSLAAGGGFDWSILTGPMSIDANGLASGQALYEDSLATVQASSGSAVGTLDLTVLNNLPDNFGSYAGDQIDDDWQVGYFGFENPDASPGIDPDGDEQDNLFEFLAKVNPTDPFSHFTFCLQPTPGQPTKQDLLFFPVFGDRSYTVMVESDLVPGNFVPLTGTTTSNDGNERTVTDNAPTGRRFYRVDISRP